MLRGWRERRRFKREVKRLVSGGEPVLREVSRAIYDDYTRIVEVFEAHGYRPHEDHTYLETWVVGKPRRR